MALGVLVRDGLRCATTSACLVHSWANRGEGGGKVVEGPYERYTRMPNEDGEEFHPPLVLLEGHDEGGALLDLLRIFLVASEI